MLGLKQAKCLIVALALTLAAPLAANAEEIRVPLDESVVHVFDENVATVAVANPAIADVSVHNGRVLLVVGRSFGTTNVIALNSEGKPIGSKRIRVTSVGGWTNVTLYKGNQNSFVSFSCAPRCERVIVPGDQDMIAAEGPKVQGQNDARAKSAGAASE